MGVYGHIKDLTDTDRDIKLDPFDAEVSLIMVGGELTSNGSGPLSIDSPLSVELYKRVDARTDQIQRDQLQRRTGRPSG